MIRFPIPLILLVLASMLLPATALAAGTPQHGAAAMLAFGAGTLPNLLVAGLAAARLRRWTAHRGVRVGAGLIVMALAVNGLWSALRLAVN